MSDPVTNLQIEDVLSSIRRLVSEETRLEPRALAKKTPKKADRLVLTPALRVADDAVDAADGEHPVAKAEAAENRPEEAVSFLTPDDASDAEPVEEITSTAKSDDAPWQDPEATLYAAAQSARTEDLSGDEADPEDTEAETATWAEGAEADLDVSDEIATDPAEASQPDEEEAAALESGDHADQGQGGELPSDLSEIEWDHDDDAGDQPQAQDPADEAEHAGTAAGEAEMSDGVVEQLSEEFADPATVTDGHDDADAETAETKAEAAERRFFEAASQDAGAAEDADMIEDADFEEIAHEAEAAKADFETEESSDAASPAGMAPFELSHQARAESLSAKIEALEAAIGKTRDQWEPDGEVGDSYAGTSNVRQMTWRDEPSDPSEPETAELSELDDAVLDEESLRELVSDIVREELQGALGERITRNVRKLVRREIHRALAAQDLE